MSQEKMTYDPETGTVQYRRKKKKGPEVTETFSALDWLARLSAQIPDQWEPMLRYYRWYAHRRRRGCQKVPAESVPVQNPEAESDFKKEARQHRAPLIKRV